MIPPIGLIMISPDIRHNIYPGVIENIAVFLIVSAEHGVVLKNKSW